MRRWHVYRLDLLYKLWFKRWITIQLEIVQFWITFITNLVLALLMILLCLRISKLSKTFNSSHLFFQITSSVTRVTFKSSYHYSSASLWVKRCKNSWLIKISLSKMQQSWSLTNWNTWTIWKNSNSTLVKSTQLG